MVLIHRVSAPCSVKDLIPFFQPIVRLRDGEVVGFEALARLPVGSQLHAPFEALAAAGVESLFLLFRSILAQTVRFALSLGQARKDVFFTINVDARVATRPDFLDHLGRNGALASLAPHRLVSEILEGEDLANSAELSTAMDGLRRIGISVALDDIGSAYASLANIKNLPADVLKLDRVFALGLGNRPHDLQFIWSMLGLARGLGKKLIVEGVETADVYDALSILGVEYVPGFFIARPMASSQVAKWIAAYRPRCASRTPKSLMGVYASHLMLVETCRVLNQQPLPLNWDETASDPHSCKIGRFFDQSNLHDTRYGRAHMCFHRVLARYGDAPVEWEAAAEAFRRALALAISEGFDRPAELRVAASKLM